MDGIKPHAVPDERILSGIHAWAYKAESIEELKHLLFCTALELESTRFAARQEIQRQEEITRQLIQHLNTICRERDEAREECLKLKEKLLQTTLSDLHSGIANMQPDSPAARSLKGESSTTECDSISDTCKHNSLVSSPAQSMFEAVSSMQEPFKLNLANSNSMDPLQQPYFEFSEQCDPMTLPAHKIQLGYLPQRCNATRYQNTEIHEDAELQHQNTRESSNPSGTCHSSSPLEEPLFFNLNPILHVSSPFRECHLSAQHQVSMQDVYTSNAHASTSNAQHEQNILVLQEHMNEESQEQEADHCFKVDQDQVPFEHLQSNILRCEANKDTRSKIGKLCSQKIAERETSWQVPESIIVDDCHMASGCSPSRALGLPPIMNHGIARLPSRSPSPQSCTEVSSNLVQSKRILDTSPNLVVPAVSVHLPEPPETDPQVIMKSFPEKGKFLEAVMKAGPLLQTLLLAGPLPQWQQPPPALNSCEIPLVSIPSVPTAGNPALNPLQPNVPAHDSIDLMHKSPSSFCCQKQNGILQAPPGTSLPSSTKINLSLTKRSLVIPSVNGDSVQETK